MTIKAGVIGCPISHSLSPIIHNYWLEKYGIDGEYKAIEVQSDDLEVFILALPENGYAGVNVTIPHKLPVCETLFPKLDYPALLIGAVNTVVVKGKEIVGKNTDSIGFINNLIKYAEYNFEHKTAVILGSGGAASAVCVGLIQSNVKQIILTNRTKQSAQRIKEYLIDSFTKMSSSAEESSALKTSLDSKINIVDWEERNKIINQADLLVNTTSCGMKGQPDLDIDLAELPEHSLVTDIVYNPLITPLLQQAKDRGNAIVDGLGMLLYQAAPGFREWFGEVSTTDGYPEVTEELRNKLLEYL